MRPRGNILLGDSTEHLCAFTLGRRVGNGKHHLLFEKASTFKGQLGQKCGRGHRIANPPEILFYSGHGNISADRAEVAEATQRADLGVDAAYARHPVQRFDHGVEAPLSGLA
ncbi:MAG: hypothetical protein OXI05_04145 [Bacteroidota bacterium]|nr:hypothetical protein [Bacteroidota bacterium]MXW14401.1 hypothetical protein [Rhodothermaceae bacterium]MDE2645017.1 hypothetical protein [Bacteroidota bacterium]MXW31725.1 hypothetical protein [Rhodothermaceae bacterium]MXZ17603.1 hypothetical protein [Rhodothermaceae bacterium]